VNAVIRFAMILGVAAVATVSVALIRSADREQAARAQEAENRVRADAAALARDDIRAALERAHSALAQLQAEQVRTDEDLAGARTAVARVVAVLGSRPGGDAAASDVLIRDVLSGVEPYLTRFVNQETTDLAVRGEQAALARDLGDIERRLGRVDQSLTYFLRSAELSRELLAAQPAEPAHRGNLGYSLAMAGIDARTLDRPDSGHLLLVGLAQLQQALAERPFDPRLLAAQFTVFHAICHQPHRPPPLPAMSRAPYPDHSQEAQPIMEK
jgi:tetratricopeptide (TPR) repeat protein